MNFACDFFPIFSFDVDLSNEINLDNDIKKSPPTSKLSPKSDTNDPKFDCKSSNIDGVVLTPPISYGTFGDGLLPTLPTSDTG